MNILEHAWCMLSHSCLPHEFWTEIVNTTTYSVNIPLCSVIDDMTLFEQRYGGQANYQCLAIFRWDSYPLTPKE